MENERLSEDKKIAAAALLLMAAICITTVLYTGDRSFKSNQVSSIMRSLGYAGTEKVTLERTDKIGVYKASMPIYTQSGNAVEYWHSRISPYGSVPMNLVRPCTDEPLEQRVLLEISFSEAEYKRILEAAGERDLSEYIVWKMRE